MPGVVKVTLNGTPLIDISDSTIDPSKVLSSYVGYEGDGDRITGTYEDSGGGDSAGKDITFIDYDGTVLYEYTKEDFLALDAMPANPNRSSEGLVAQGWNWTLSDAKAYLNTGDGDYYDELIIGQSYDTSDHHTRMFITIPNRSNEPRGVMVTVQVSAVNDALIDWGDSTPTETNSTTGTVSFNHTYAASGDYVITISKQTSVSNTFGIGGTNTDTQNDYRGLDTYLTKVYIGSDFNHIGHYAFRYCTNLSYVSFPAKNISFAGQEVTYYTGLKALVIPSGVTTFGTYIFRYSTSLEIVSLPKSVTTFTGSNTFQGCRSLKRITLPHGITTISSNCFQYCNSLEKITLPRNLSGTNTYTFNQCTGLKSLKIFHLTSIENYAFYYCYSLKEINFVGGSPSSIGSYAFGYCQSLQEVTLSDSTTSISTYAFYYCHSLRKINLPNNINFTLLQSGMFTQCNSLPEITIPKYITAINGSFLSSTTAITRIYCLPTTPPSLSSLGVTLDRGDRIYVPHGCLTDYQNASGWSSYAAYMVEMDE